jgi:hypothetical protein
MNICLKKSVDFLSDNYFDTDRCSEKNFYFKIHFYSHIFYQRDLLIQIINILCTLLKCLDDNFSIKYTSKLELKNAYYLYNRNLAEKQIFILRDIIE